MRLYRTFLVGLALAFGLSLQAAKPAPQTLADLQARIAEHVSQPKFRAGTFGVKIVSARTGSVIFEHDSHELLSPASNAKLYTVGLALDRLGPDYKIRTSLYTTAKVVDGTLEGDLILYGRGDPTINPRVRGSLSKAVEPLLTALADAGVRQVKGDLIADESFFRGPEYGSGWTWDDLEYYYGAEISSLTINDNLVALSIKPGASAGAPCRLSLIPPSNLFIVSNRTVTVTTGARRTTRVIRQADSNVLHVTGQMPADDQGYSENVTVRSPSALFLEIFHAALAQRQIKINGNLRVVNWVDRLASPLNFSRLTELGGMDSPPMKDLAREVQKPSQNLYTDILLAYVGEKTRAGLGASALDTSEDLGIRELRKFLNEAGIQRHEVHFEEGSGLSRNNLTTPNATIALLQHMNRHPAADAYWEALPVAGVDGTLRSRMKSTVAEGNVRAKTGTLRWAYALSGDVRTAAGERLLFSLMLNRYYNQDPVNTTRAELDVIPVMLAGFAGKIQD
jgi:serine-type D-Ala-D-Ala carboxypeptidase/endopeptidase (penicillin-binding protein 4)